MRHPLRLLAVGATTVALVGCSTTTAGHPISPLNQAESSSRTANGSAHDPCTLLTRADATTVVPHIASVATHRAAAIGAFPEYRYCTYWSAAPSTTTPQVTLGVATGQRTQAQLQAEVATLNPPAVPDPVMPGFLVSYPDKLPGIQFYTVKDGVELTINLASNDVTESAVEELARRVLARV